MENSGKKILSGAIILGVGTFIAKLLGAFYRIPLTKTIGGTGLGLYQMVFPVYTLLLDFSGAGVPNALAKLIASQNSAEKEVYSRKILRVALMFFSAVGGVLTLLTLIFSAKIATAQGNSDAGLAYVYLAPSVFIVCLICCFRGYFQGFMNMVPTAVSQIAEQVVKLGLGVLFASAFLPDIPKAVAGATLAITVSEFAALIFIACVYVLKSKKKRSDKNAFAFYKKSLKIDGKEFLTTLKSLLSYVVPIALTGMILPLSKVADSFLIVNILSAHTENATGVYGLYSGVAVTVVGLPVAICYGISVVAVPLLSKAEEKNRNKDALKTLALTFAFSVPCAVFVAIEAPFIIRVLYGYLSENERVLSVNLLRVISPCVVLLSLLQTVNGVLIGKGNPKKPLIGMAVGVSLKTVIEIFALENPEIGIYGVGVAAIACYLVANLVNLTLVFKAKPKTGEITENAGARIKNRRYAGL